MTSMDKESPNLSERRFGAHVIGHTGCAKCAMLNRRLDALLQESPYKEHFVKVYHDTEDPRGMEQRELALVFFCRCQCINPNRIPALIITDESGEFLPRPARPECALLQSAHIYQFIGIQTDYSAGGGVITPAMIKETLDEAIACMEKRNH